MMKRIARAVRGIGPTDAIAMLKETSLASGMEMEVIRTHVMVSNLGVLRLRLNDFMYYVLDVGRKQKHKTKQCLKICALLQTFSKRIYIF